MKTQSRRHALWGGLLVGLVVLWYTREAGSLEALTAWGVQLGSWRTCTLMGLYSIAPSLHAHGATPQVTGTLLCAAILGPVIVLMVTTIGSMTTYLLGRALVGRVWTSRVTQVVEAVGLPATRMPQAE